MAYLDFSKAFDTIDHNIFIKKIKHIGFSETPLKWFDSYLKERSQIVIANNTKSMCNYWSPPREYFGATSLPLVY